MAAIEQPHPSQTVRPPTPAHGLAVPIHHFMEALVALRHIQAQRQEPEQHQHMVVPEDDKVKKLKSNIGCSEMIGCIREFLIFHLSLKKKCYLLTTREREYVKVLQCLVLYSFLYSVI